MGDPSQEIPKNLVYLRYGWCLSWHTLHQQRHLRLGDLIMADTEMQREPIIVVVSDTGMAHIDGIIDRLRAESMDIHGVQRDIGSITGWAPTGELRTSLLGSYASSLR